MSKIYGQSANANSHALIAMVSCSITCNIIEDINHQILHDIFYNPVSSKNGKIKKPNLASKPYGKRYRNLPFKI